MTNSLAGLVLVRWKTRSKTFPFRQLAKELDPDESALRTFGRGRRFRIEGG